MYFGNIDLSLKRDTFSKSINIMKLYIPSARICASSVTSKSVFPSLTTGLMLSPQKKHVQLNACPGFSFAVVLSPQNKEERT